MEDSVMEERLRQMDKEIAEIKTNIAVLQVSLTMVKDSLDSLNANPVSYTHLTLPTICSV